MIYLVLGNVSMNPVGKKMRLTYTRKRQAAV